jgi:hypothetical protein
VNQIGVLAACPFLLYVSRLIYACPESIEIRSNGEGGILELLSEDYSTVIFSITRLFCIPDFEILVIKLTSQRIAAIIY